MICDDNNARPDGSQVKIPMPAGISDYYSPPYDVVITFDADTTIVMR